MPAGEPTAAQSLESAAKNLDSLSDLVQLTPFDGNLTRTLHLLPSNEARERTPDGVVRAACDSIAATPTEREVLGSGQIHQQESFACD